MTPVTGLPLMVMEPLVSLRIPEMHSANSLWPFPSTPATPTISPACTVRLKFLRAGIPRSSTAFTSFMTRTGSLSAKAGRSFLSMETGRPTIIWANVSCVASFVFTVPMYLPSRITVTPVCNLDHLAQFMAYENDRTSFFCNMADGAAELVAFRRSQHSRGLVQHQDLTVPVQGLQDFHPLLSAYRQAPHNFIRVHIKLIFLAQFQQSALCRFQIQMLFFGWDAKNYISMTESVSTNLKCWCTMPTP